MKFVCQQRCVESLQNLASHKRHSILIEGMKGSGKTYLAREYSKMLSIMDFEVVESTVANIKESLDMCYRLNNPIVVCIENLDLGVPAASYALLKFLEEPSPNVYVVITCRNRYDIPDTIVSRSICVTTSSLTDSDIDSYAKASNLQRYERVKSLPIWNCVRTFQQIDTVLSLTEDQIQYLQHIPAILFSKEPVSSIVWKIGHYEDSSECPVDLVIDYVMWWIQENPHPGRMNRKRFCIDCLRQLSSKRIAEHAVLSKFVMECKYSE